MCYTYFILNEQLIYSEMLQKLNWLNYDNYIFNTKLCKLLLVGLLCNKC